MLAFGLSALLLVLSIVPGVMVFPPGSAGPGQIMVFTVVALCVSFVPIVVLLCPRGTSHQLAIGRRRWPRKAVRSLRPEKVRGRKGTTVWMLVLQTQITGCGILRRIGLTTSVGRGMKGTVRDMVKHS